MSIFPPLHLSLAVVSLLFFATAPAVPFAGCPGKTSLHLSGIVFSGDTLCAARGELKLTRSKIPAGARSVLVAGRIALSTDPDRDGDGAGNSTDRVFLIQLLRDARGVWKVEGM